MLAVLFAGAWVIGRYSDERAPGESVLTSMGLIVGAESTPSSGRRVYARPAVEPSSKQGRSATPQWRPSVAVQRGSGTTGFMQAPTWPEGARLVGRIVSRGVPAVARTDSGVQRPQPVRLPTPDPAPPSADEAAGTAAAPRPPPEPTPPPTESLTIGNIVVNASSSTVRVTYRTNLPATTQGAAGLDSTPMIWTTADAAVVDHEKVFSQLSPATTYRFWVQALDAWNRTTMVAFTAVTALLGSRPSAAVSGDTVLVDNQPFFPLAVWNACTNEVGAKIDVGINLFMAEGCGQEARLPAVLSGKAYSVVDAASGLAEGPGLIGWYYPDELDGRLSAPISEADVTKMGVTPPPGMLRFLTLTNHFYSRTAPLPIGRSIYPIMFGFADVLGFDLYPMQNWCRDKDIGDVYDAQRELDEQTAHKPTFQWIEVRVMDCPATPDLTPTPATVRAETWLAIAGGADAIGYFPHDWTADVGVEIKSLNHRIKELAPALLAEDVPVQVAQAPLKVGARALNGAIYVIAINPSRAPVKGTFTVNGLGGKPLIVVDEQRRVASVDGVITDDFAPLAVHIYVAAPANWNWEAATAEPEGEAQSSP